jgi:methionyl-tRNA synthetase
MEWYCFKCKEKMVEAEVNLVYGDMKLPGAFGVQCPKCGAEYLLEEFVLTQVNEGEKMLEAK